MKYVNVEEFSYDRSKLLDSPGYLAALNIEKYAIKNLPNANKGHVCLELREEYDIKKQPKMRTWVELTIYINNSKKHYVVNDLSKKVSISCIHSYSDKNDSELIDRVLKNFPIDIIPSFYVKHMGI